MKGRMGISTLFIHATYSSFNLKRDFTVYYLKNYFYLLGLFQIASMFNIRNYFPRRSCNDKSQRQKGTYFRLSEANNFSMITVFTGECHVYFRVKPQEFFAKKPLYSPTAFSVGGILAAWWIIGSYF